MPKKTTLLKKLILKHLYFNSTLSAAALSWRINKSLPLTTKYLNELVQENFVVESGYAPSTGGRRPIMYSLREDFMYVISVAIDQFVSRIAIMDMQNRNVTTVKKVELKLAANKNALQELTKHLREFILQSGIRKEKIVGVGIGMPGFVDGKKGVNYTFFESGGTSITEEISKEIGIPVFIDNDSSLIALAELRFGAAKGKKNVMVINVGWGVGLGMIVNGELFRGHNGFAGEFSHIPLFWNGKLCSCGKTGCLETETSLLTVIQKAKEAIGDGRPTILQEAELASFETGSEAIIKAALEGDRFAVELFSEAGYNIGRGVAILIHILNPEVIVLSGRGAAVGKLLQAPIQQALNEHCIPRLAINTSVEISSLGYQAEITGAACLVMEHFDAVPKEESRSKVFS